MKSSFVTPIIKKIAQEEGIKIIIEPQYGYVGQIILPDGRKRYFHQTDFDLNYLGAAEVAKDKAYAAYFMKLMGYPVPEGESFFTDYWCSIIGSDRNAELAYRYARTLGFPVIVKPNSKSQGWGVCKVFNKKEFMKAVRSLGQREKVFLVQRLLQGNDYRIVVLDDEIISAYQRLPLAVVGNGLSTVADLLVKKQEDFKKIGRGTIIPIDDFRIDNQLKRLNMFRTSIPAEGQRVELLPNANLSTGGDAIDVSEEMHDEWRKFSIKVVRDMGLRFCGVDIMASGTLMDKCESFVVLEINAAPGLDNYASVGKLQRERVEAMYRKVFRAMIR